MKEEFIRRKKDINITPDDFVAVLDKLVHLERKEIATIIESEPKTWMRKANL